MTFQVLTMLVAILGAFLFVVPFLYLVKPKHKCLLSSIIGLVTLLAFVCGLYYIYHPFPFEEGLRAYDTFKSYYVDLFGALWGFILAVPCLIILAALVALANRRSAKESPTFHESRRTLLKGLGLAIPLITMGGGILAAKNGQEDLVVKEETFAFKDLPQVLENYKIVQLSDVHIGAFIDMDNFDNLVSTVLAQRPNRLVITGDLIDDLDRLPALCKRLEALAPLIPDGIDYIYGNHEHFRNYKLVKEMLAKSPMRILDNANERIFDGPHPVYIAGVNYDLKRDPQVRQAYMKEAMAGIPQGAFIILLAHHPEFFDNALEYGVELTLAGHTHGGQMVLANQALVPVGTPYVKGRYEKDGKFCYVNSGAGHWYPVRINCPREITVINLRKA